MIKTKTLLSFVALVGMGLALIRVSFSQSGRMRAIFFNNTAFIISEPKLPIEIDGTDPVSGHPWFESRIFAPPGPPPSLDPKIEVQTSIEPSNFLRPPGRTIPSPAETLSYSFASTSTPGVFRYRSQWPRIFTPRDGRNTVVLALVNRRKSVLFNTNFDLFFKVDQEVIEDASGTQTFTVRLTPRAPSLNIIVRVRSQATEQADVRFLAQTATPPPSSSTPTSLIWTPNNPPVGETLTFSAQASVQNFASPTAVRHIPDVLITASLAPQNVGTATGSSVQFPRAFCPPSFRA